MSRRTEKTEQTKADFQQAFWRLYALRTSDSKPGMRPPIERISIQELSDEAGYYRGTFYQYYCDIYDLLEIEEKQLLDGMTSCVASCMERLSADKSKPAKILALKDVILFYERNKERILVLLGNQGDPAFIPRLKDALKPLWREQVIGEAVAGRSEGEIDLLLEYTLSGALYMIGRWLRDPADVSAAQMGHLVYDLAIRDASIRAQG